MQNWIQRVGSSAVEHSWYDGKRVVNYDLTGLSEDDQLKKALSISFGGSDGAVHWDEGYTDEPAEEIRSESDGAEETGDEQSEFEWGDEGIHQTTDLGDYIETYYDDPHFQGGTVVGVIKNIYGDPVCYKVWTKRAGLEMFDYISADRVYLSEPYGSVSGGLGAIGYKYVEDDASPYDGYFYNKKTGDKVFW